MLYYDTSIKLIIWQVDYLRTWARSVSGLGPGYWFRFKFAYSKGDVIIQDNKLLLALYRPPNA